MRLGPRVVRHGDRGRGRRRPGVGRPPGDGRHHARGRPVPPVPARPPARVREPAGGRDPRRTSGRPGRTARRSRSPRCTGCRTRSTRCSAPWSNPAATPCAPLRAADLQPGDRVLVLGPGTIGLLVAMFARAAGAEVHLLGRSEELLGFPRALGFADAWTADNLPDLPFDAVIDASNAPHLPARRWSWSSPPAAWCTSASPARPACSTPGSSRSRTSPQSGSCPRHRDSTRPSRPMPTGRSTHGPWSPRRSAWTRSVQCWPAGDRTAPVPDPRSTSTHDSLKGEK